MNAAKERVSISVVNSLIAQAGLNVSTWTWDDGIDLTIGSSKAGFCGVSIRNVCFHFQVKSTADWQVKSGKISFRLRVDKYNQLAGESWGQQYLVLYTLPRERWKWVSAYDDHGRFNHCAYYLCFDGVKPIPDPNAKPDPNFKTTLQIPTSNRLTASELLRMYKLAGRTCIDRRKPRKPIAL